jgi:hypothetical protein
MCASLSDCSGDKEPGQLFNNEGRFRRIIVDVSGPTDPWGKSVGDLDGDGFPDFIVGGHGSAERSMVSRVFDKLGFRKFENPLGELVWYRNPTWLKLSISKEYRFSTDHEVADIDGDGLQDVVSLTESKIIWFRNPDWRPFIIDERALHDIEVADFDGDGDFDIVARNQSGFNHDDGDRLHFYRQDSPTDWAHFSILVPHGEGLKTADMNGDEKEDVIINMFWYENPGVLRSDVSWEKRAYAHTWKWPDVSIDVSDINRDGWPDIVLAPSEPEGKRYHISWFEAPESESGEWVEHVIDHNVETVRHFVGAHDMNNDGWTDVVTAQMHQGEDPDEIAVYWNVDGEGLSWKKEVIGSTGSHNMRAVDADKDGDIDLFGANWSGERQAIELWENLTPSRILPGWKRHVIDDAKPWRSVFIMAEDLDQDGHRDILTGAWWYRNPGNLAGPWVRRPFGTGANNVAFVQDFDKDGCPDILASDWKDDGGLRFHERILRRLRIRSYPTTGGGFVWARNDGKGDFEILSNIMKGEGDFLQGAAILASESGNEIILSWHESGHGIQALRIPDDPVHEIWPRRRISEISQDEQITVGDIDGDAKEDIVLGTKWLRNEANDEWTPFVLHVSEEGSDRNRLADINGDGRPNVVIGYEAISLPGRVAWYEQGSDPMSTWTEHLVGYVIGPMSLDVGDLDGDGDLDIVVGEHNLRKPNSSRLLIFENVDGRGHEWKEHVLFIGDEHHNGAQFADIDGDGDLDIISIGWGHGRVLLYENVNWKRGNGCVSGKASKK